MANVRVWNDNTYPYTEQFRDQKIHIPAKGFIMMEAGEAHLFRGSFAPVQLDGDGNPHPSGYKMIRIEETSSEPVPAVTVNEKKCIACAYEATSKADLDEHVKAAHAADVVVDEEAEAEIKKRGRPRKAS